MSEGKAGPADAPDNRTPAQQKRRANKHDEEEDPFQETPPKAAAAPKNSGKKKVRYVNAGEKETFPDDAASAFREESPDLIFTGYGSPDPEVFEDFEDEDVDDGAGPAAPPQSHWVTRIKEMDDLLETQRQERDIFLAQIKDLEDNVKGIESRITDTKKAKAQFELLKRQETTANPTGINHLSRLYPDIKFILKMFLTGLDLTHLSAVDSTWRADIMDQPASLARIQDEKNRWTRAMERIETPVTCYAAYPINFTWYNENRVLISRDMTATYEYRGMQTQTHLFHGSNHYYSFYGGKDYLYAYKFEYNGEIIYAKWGEPKSTAHSLYNNEKCKDIVPFNGHLYFADVYIVRQFNPSASTIHNHPAITRLPAGRKTPILKFALSETYVLKAKSTKVELWLRESNQVCVTIAVTGVKCLAMAGNTICIQKSDSITLYGNDGQPKRIYSTLKERLSKPLGHVDGSFIFEKETRDPQNLVHGPNRLFRLARHAEYDKLIDEDMRMIISKQYSRGGKLGVFIQPEYPVVGRCYLYVNQQG